MRISYILLFIYFKDNKLLILRQKQRVDKTLCFLPYTIVLVNRR